MQEEKTSTSLLFMGYMQARPSPLQQNSSTGPILLALPAVFDQEVWT